MISVTEAKRIIKENIQLLTPVTVAIQEVAGLVLAEDVFASIDIPAFNQSAMDGYAFAFDSYMQNKNLNITGEVQAGADISFENLKGKSVRIFTGAPVPNGADTVVMQEKTTVENNQLTILDDQLIKGSNVRPKGAEIKKRRTCASIRNTVISCSLRFFSRSWCS